MSALNLDGEFEHLYGVNYFPELRDGADFSGRARRVARRLGQEQDRADQELFDAHGGLHRVRARLFERWDDPARDLTELTTAEQRLMLMISVDTARTAPMSVIKIDEVVGYGVFADRLIRAGDVIGEYTGLLRKFRPEDMTNHYLASTPAYGRYDGFIIDGQDQGNITRFINHSHRSDNVANAFVFHGRRWHRIMRAARAITPGEQVLWNYGEDYWRAREAPADL
jgi:hypothetical protein